MSGVFSTGHPEKIAHTPALLYPLTKPSGPRLSAHVREIAKIEQSHWLTNYGPTNRRLEAKIVAEMFDGHGHCLMVCNATIGLIIALKLATLTRKRRQKFVLMPSFTFAAAAHAVIWAGLTPLLVDIDPLKWSACQAEEERLLEIYGERIAAIMPYATFGSCIDLARYDRLSEQYNVPIVVDAAASIGSVDDEGRAFGCNSRHTIVFSMHATKAFGVGECGMVYSADQEKIEALRRMGNFGLDADRAAIMPGLNSKLSEIGALTALIKLADYRTPLSHRAELAQLYRDELPGWTAQSDTGMLIAHQFMPLLLPRGIKAHRDFICARLNEVGIGTGRYFSPHIRQQSYFRKLCAAGPLTVTDEVASRIVSLPMSDFLSRDDVLRICEQVNAIEDEFSHSVSTFSTGEQPCSQHVSTP